MKRSINPYIAGPPVRKGRQFFGRQDILKWVDRELHNPNTNALVLYGHRRIGKTSLLLQLQRRLDSDAFLPVYFDLQPQVDRPLGRVLTSLAEEASGQAGIEPPSLDIFDDQGRSFCSHSCT